jgi:hypothetical protein
MKITNIIQRYDLKIEFYYFIDVNLKYQYEY